MLRRLLLVVVPLLAGLFIALAIPLGSNIAQRETQITYLDRLADAERFASLADDAINRGRTVALAAELRRYAKLYDSGVTVVAPDGSPMLAAGEPIELDAPEVRRGLNTAFAGYRLNRIDTVWPWQSDPMVVVEPVGRGSSVLAAVIIVAPTGDLREAILWSWAVLAAAAIGTFLLALTATIPLSRWVLRPVRDLDGATTALAAGRLDARAPALAGPPELRRFATSFNTMAEVVTQTLRRQRAFVGEASHQLRNPIASLRLSVENLEPYISDTGRQEHNDALEEAAELGRIVDTLLALTRIEETGPAESAQPTGQVVAEHQQRWRDTLRAADMSLSVDVTEEPATYAPGEVLGQLLDELVGNAARLSGGSHVDVVATGAGERVIISVTDDGRGLAPEDIHRAGERFWRGPAHQNIPGTGMGMAICTELVASWGGSLELCNVDPHGLTARVVLPSAAESDSPA